MRPFRYTLVSLLLFSSFLGIGQELPAEEKPSPWTLNGYVKDLQALFIFRDPALPQPLSIQLNQIHNRVNVGWHPAESFRVRLELRNRLFWGDQMNSTFIEQLDGANDWLNLSAGAAYPATRTAWHTMLDRLFLEWNHEKWEVRLGRQRINWGISTVWNPNDVFNAFAFTDFDYEERPGSDALRVRYFTGAASSMEFAVRGANGFDELVAAMRFQFNHGVTDWQVLGGWAEGDLAIGGGWASSIGLLGFKGETTLFLDPGDQADHSFAATFGLDYITSKSLYLQTGFLFNSRGSTQGAITSLFDFELSAKNLYPYQYSLFLQAGYPFTPLFSGGVAIIYSPGEAHAMFVNPSLTWSIAENWDLDFIGQLGFNRSQGQYLSPIQGMFLRVKWSF